MPFHGTLECPQHRIRPIPCRVDAVMTSFHNRECQWMRISTKYANSGSAFLVVQWDESGGERWRARSVPLRKKVSAAERVFSEIASIHIDSVEVHFLRTCQWCFCIRVLISVCVFLPLPVSLSLYPGLHIYIYICMYMHMYAHVSLFHIVTYDYVLAKRWFINCVCANGDQAVAGPLDFDLCQ